MSEPPQTHYDDHLPVCAAIPHGILDIMLVYCPHQMSYRGYFTQTDDSGASLDSLSVAFGPFDGTEQIVGRAAHEVLRWIGAEQERRWPDRE